ncbi:hypothetical protein [Microbacterium tumbae]
MTLRFLHARHLLAVVLVVLVLQAVLAFVGARSLTFFRPDFLAATSLAALGQFIPVAAALIVYGSQTRDAERLASQPLWPQRLLLHVIVLTVCAGTALLLSRVLGLMADEAVTGTTGTLAPLRNMLGLLGAGLIAARFLDRRIAAVAPATLVLLPVVVNPGQYPFSETWGFVLTDTGNPANWVTAIALPTVGCALHLRTK